MNYLEYHFITETAGDAEILIALLAENGFDTFEQEENELSAYIPQNEHSARTDAFLTTLQKDFSFRFTVKEYKASNWNEEWEKNFEPVLIGGRCLIRAPFHKPAEDIEFEIIIEPRMSFGTGHHESTRLMIEEMLVRNFEGLSVADAGSGTGVLSILAAKKGAKVYAVDNNEWAIQAGIDNIALNKVMDLVDIESGDIQLLRNRSFDIILANISKSVILEGLPVLSAALAPGGILILSGILVQDIGEISDASAPLGLGLISSREREEWICAVYGKNA